MDFPTWAEATPLIIGILTALGFLFAYRSTEAKRKDDAAKPPQLSSGLVINGNAGLELVADAIGELTKIVTKHHEYCTENEGRDRRHKNDMKDAIICIEGHLSRLARDSQSREKRADEKE